ncbi:MAG TPA: hypothetical protein VIG95_09280 [Gemmatimonadales bacterium]
MRLLSLVLSFLLTVSLVTAGLAYLEQRVGEQRIHVQAEWLSASDSTPSASPMALGH